MKDIKIIQVRDKDLLKIREIVRNHPRDCKVRRFLVDAHNGRNYWHTEINEVSIPGINEMEDFEIIEYIKRTCLEKGKLVYSIIEILGNIDIGTIGKMPPEVIADIVRPLYYDAFTESLDSFPKSI